MVLKSTYLGKAIRATVQDGEAAQLWGFRYLAYSSSLFLPARPSLGLSACVMIPLFSVFPSVGLNFVLIAFVVVVLGGDGQPGRRIAWWHMYRRRAVT